MGQLKIIKQDPYLEPFNHFFCDTKHRIEATEERLTQKGMSLSDFACGHHYFGLHFEDCQWVLREWAPNATNVFLIGPFSHWKPHGDFRFSQVGNGNWEIKLAGDFLKHEDLYSLHITWNGGAGERLPSYGRRVVQDERTKIFCAQVWQPQNPYQWKKFDFKRREEPLLIYETHIGMAQEAERVGTYREFKDNVLPRIVRAGYNTVQIMAVQEHPYYGSFGYQVSNFFAPSSRFGTPDELKELIDAAHAEGLQVFLDIVHSHAVKNEVEGLSRFDGTLYQFFHDGPRGNHPVWDSRLFNYGKIEVLHFLLSNIKYWVEEFRFDGFRFDGVTSMLYFDHGFGKPFTSYDEYFSGRVDQEALVYLALANKLAHELGDITTIAEDVSGLPGLAAPLADGGFGFDYRLAMGIPDLWKRTIEKKRDEDWHVEEIYHELTNHRAEEKTISYAECHDQALVGDKTIIFRLLDYRMYHQMRIEHKDHLIDRGLAIHRLIRLLTISTASAGYLNFMGNEFGHPEWIDFPRQGNNWSYFYARRQWSLVDNPNLQYQRLAEFDRRMIEFVRAEHLLTNPHTERVYTHYEHQILCFKRGGLLFCVNLNPSHSFADYPIPAPRGDYVMIFDTDAECFGGNNRLSLGQIFSSIPNSDENAEEGELRVYLPTRTGIVLRPLGFHLPKNSQR